MTDKKKQDPKAIAGGCGIMIVITVIIAIFIGTCGDDTPPIPLTKEEIRKQELQSQFSLWDGSHIKLEKLIKQSLNDPNSYEHIRTTYNDEDSVLIVLLQYRANNLFGGKIPKSVKAMVNMDGDVLLILEEK